MKRALIIEDNENNMKLLSFILEKHGFTVLEAWNGEDGVRMAEEEKPDFILLDIQLPDIEGTEVLARIRGRDACGGIPIIAVTSYAMSGDRERLLAAGCNGYIEKPIDSMTIIDQIREVIGEVP